jgi:hypothetical protein
VRLVKIRHFGFLANRGRTANIQLCRTLLEADSPNVSMDLPITKSPQADSSDRCPQCQKGCLRPIAMLWPPPVRLSGSPAPLPALVCDTSWSSLSGHLGSGMPPRLGKLHGNLRPCWPIAASNTPVPRPYQHSKSSAQPRRTRFLAPYCDSMPITQRLNSTNCIRNARVLSPLPTFLSQHFGYNPVRYDR